MSDYLIKYDSDGVRHYYRKSTLAHLLDKRSISINEPDAGDLPAEINSLEFVFSNLLSNHCSVIKLLYSEITDDLTLLSLTDSLIAPEQNIVYYIEVDGINAEVSLDSTEIASGCTAAIVAETVPVNIATTASLIPLYSNC